jgi:hypothetical protein
MTLTSQLEDRLSMMRTDRYSWWIHWAELARYILPRRYRWLVTPNQMTRGSQINTAIVDSTGTTAARALSSGMMSGITSPTRPWFKLRIPGVAKDEANAINNWLADCEQKMMRVFQESNFYNAIAVVYSDLAVFGTAPMIIYQDFENVIHCFNPCAGEYYVNNGPGLHVNTLYREMTYTIAQTVDEFGEDNCSDTVRAAYRRGGGELSREIKIKHAIEPRRQIHGIPEKFTYAEVYWEDGNATNADGKERFLRKRGFYECPFIAPRWDTSGNDAYGRSPGMDALGDIKQLQQETRRKAQAIDKLANPPMVADVELKNQPASTIPGGVTYLTKKDGVGFAPAYQNFRPPIQEIMLDIQEVQERIKVTFFNDLFLMISQLQTVRTATEIDARREEKLIMLGPVLERFQTEALDLIIDRVFNIMLRGNLFEPPPVEVQGSRIDVEYVSMLAAAQSAVSTSVIERLLAQVGNIAGVYPQILAIPNWEECIIEYNAKLGGDPRLVKSLEELRAIKEADARRMQAEQAAQASMAGIQGAKLLSETTVGGGKNALETMLNASGAVQ